MQSADSYQDIFDLRGERYHAAMRRCPLARKEELALLPRAVGIQAGETLVDAFDGEVEMLAFVRDLFGIDCADDATLRDAVYNILGVRKNLSSGVIMNWQLLMATGIRPQ